MLEEAHYYLGYQKSQCNWVGPGGGTWVSSKTRLIKSCFEILLVMCGLILASFQPGATNFRFQKQWEKCVYAKMKDDVGIVNL